MTIMMSSDMKFLDDPHFSLNRSFDNPIYYKKIGQQINSLLYIVEAFANQQEASEIEERLELRLLKIAEKIKLKLDN